MKDVLVVAPATATLTCNLKPCEPVPKITWSKGARDIDAGGRYEMTFADGVATLTIKDTEAKDDSDYKCTATNKVGKAEANAYLTVHSKCQTNQTMSRY